MGLSSPWLSSGIHVHMDIMYPHTHTHTHTQTIVQSMKYLEKVNPEHEQDFTPLILFSLALFL